MAPDHARSSKFGATRWAHHDYASPGAYFFTICSHDRAPLFEDERLAEVVNGAWKDVPRHFPNVSLDAFVLMPNHVHGVLVITGEGITVAPQHAETRKPPSVSIIVRSFKAATTREARICGLLTGNRLWQPNFYDRVIRDGQELDRVREYIAHNPVAWRFDRENPARIPNGKYVRLWGWLEGTLANP